MSWGNGGDWGGGGGATTFEDTNTRGGFGSVSEFGHDVGKDDGFGSGGGFDDDAGGDGGDRACFNCGEAGYMLSAPFSQSYTS